MLLFILFITLFVAAVFVAKSDLPGKLGIVLKRVGFFTACLTIVFFTNAILGMVMLWAIGLPAWLAFCTAFICTALGWKSYWTLAVKFSALEKGEFAESMSDLKASFKTWASSKVTGVIDKLAQ